MKGALDSHLAFEEVIFRAYQNGLGDSTLQSWTRLEHALHDAFVGLAGIFYPIWSRTGDTICCSLRAGDSGNQKVLQRFREVQGCRVMVDEPNQMVITGFEGARLEVEVVSSQAYDQVEHQLANCHLMDLKAFVSAFLGPEHVFDLRVDTQNRRRLQGSYTGVSSRFLERAMALAYTCSGLRHTHGKASTAAFREDETLYLYGGGMVLVLKPSQKQEGLFAATQ